MVKKILRITTVFLLMAMLAACGSIESNNGAGPDNTLSYHASGNRDQCKHFIINAFLALSNAKKNTRHHDIYIDWGDANEKLAAALAAQQHQDYDLCVASAQLVINYVEREQNYISWRHSLKP